jgi:Fe-S cluster assembly protein SufD
VSETAPEQDLDAQFRRLPDAGAAAAERRAALTRYRELGLPTPRQESWRYTDLKRLASTAFEFAPDVPGSDAATAVAALLARHGLDERRPRLVFVDGHELPELGDLSPEASRCVANLAADFSGFVQHYAVKIAAEDHPLASLNTAFVQQGPAIRVPPGIRMGAPLHLVFVASERDRVAPQPRVLIELGAEAELTVVEHWLDCGDPAGWINSVTQVMQAEGSRLELYRIQEHGAEQTHTALLKAELQAGAALSVGYVDLGGRLVRNDIEVKLLAPGAQVDLFGVLLAAGGQHVDDHTRIDHVGAETRSDEAFRSIIGHGGHGVVNGKVVVHRNAQRIDARQTNDNLLLADHAEIDAKPELEIYADDVKCSHGSTVGELDEDQLFYLRARGVAEADAREMLTIAFADAVLERIREPALREAVVARVAERSRAIIRELP